MPTRSSSCSGRCRSRSGGRTRIRGATASSRSPTPPPTSTPPRRWRSSWAARSSGAATAGCCCATPRACGSRSSRPTAPRRCATCGSSRSDLDRSLEWWGQLGFVDGAAHRGARQRDLAAQDGREITAERCIVGTDDDSFGIVFTTWSGPQPVGPTYAVPYHEGIYRMAMAVDDVHAAYETLLEAGVPRVQPYTFQLPGTKLTNGLTILFIRDPDGILVELVDRPRGHGLNAVRRSGADEGGVVAALVLGLASSRWCRRRRPAPSPGARRPWRPAWRCAGTGRSRRSGRRSSTRSGRSRRRCNRPR